MQISQELTEDYSHSGELVKRFLEVDMCNSLTVIKFTYHHIVTSIFWHFSCQNQKKAIIYVYSIE
jgi:hypothetical protein